LAVAIVGILYRSYAENDRRNNAAIATIVNSSSSVIVLRDEIVLIIHDHNSNTVAEAADSLGRLTSHNTSVDRLTVQGGTLDATAIKKLVDTRGIKKLQLDSSIVSDAAWNNLESLDNTLIELRLVNLKLSEFAARHIATLKCLKSIDAVETDLSKRVRDYLRRVRPDVTVEIGPEAAFEQRP
jgi:hypothetical protein